MNQALDDTTIKRKLYSYCAYQDRCRQEIEEKLEGWEVPDEEWEMWLQHLASERFWDESRYVRSFVRGKFYHKQWGRQRIRLELRQRGIPHSMIDPMIAAEIPEQEVQKTLERLIEKKWAEYRQTHRDRLIRFLLQKGFVWQEFSALLPAESSTAQDP